MKYMKVFKFVLIAHTGALSTIMSLFVQNLVSPQNIILQEEEKTFLFFYFIVFFVNDCI